MGPMLLKSRAVLLISAVVIAAGGAVTGVLLTRPHQEMAEGLPLPSAPPTENPAPVSADNSQALMAAPSPVPAPVAQQSAPALVPAAYDGAGPVPTPSPAPGAVMPAAPGLSSDQLNQLLGPIALYPDPLIAEILPAATYPDQLAAAALWLRYNPAAPDYAIESQPWEPAIKALAHSPSVLVWMYNNPDWTRTLGTAFTYQPQDVMNAVQYLRSLALADGTLVDTPQQLVVTQDNSICIEPAVPNELYVPVYDWRTAYGRRDDLTFFAGAPIGPWFDGDFDWDHRDIVVGAHWDRGWDHRWDHDQNAREVIVRNNPRSEDRHDDRAAPAPADRTVRVGGTHWQRNDARPAPSYPTSVRPARPADGRAPEVRTPAPQPRQPVITPREPQPPAQPRNENVRPEGRTIAPPAPEVRTPAAPEGRTAPEGRSAPAPQEHAPAAPRSNENPGRGDNREDNNRGLKTD